MTLTGCAAPGLWTDFTSISHGVVTEGRLRHPSKLPASGRGYMVPQEWRGRRRSYGTDELIAAIERAAAVVQGGDSRVVLGVADISSRRGGDITGHGSHESGRDVDLLFYTVDKRGRPLRPPSLEMLHFRADGRVFVPMSLEEGYREPNYARRRFDDARNWGLVEALLTDPTIRIQWIFVSDPLRTRLLDWAVAHARPSWVVDYASVVMRQPRTSKAHDDHFHVRLYCSRRDRIYGCVDSEPLWQHEKKTAKYLGPEAYDGRLEPALPVDPVLMFLPRG